MLSFRYFQGLLVDLAIRSLEAPGESFRVGVNGPLRGDRMGGALSSAVAFHMHARGTSPAVMRVRVHFSDEGSGEAIGPNLITKPMNRRSSVQLVDALMQEGMLSSMGAPKLEAAPKTPQGGKRATSPDEEMQLALDNLQKINPKVAVASY